MFGKLLFLFIAIPLVEISLLIQLGSLIGFWPTIFIQVGTGILGASLARLQGFWVWERVMREFQAGRVPAEEMLSGVLIFVAGLVLMTPGLITDLFGFALLIPLSRNAFKRWLRRQFDLRMDPGRSVFPRQE